MTIKNLDDLNINATYKKLNLIQSTCDKGDEKMQKSGVTRSPLHVLQFLITYAGLRPVNKIGVITNLHNIAQLAHVIVTQEELDELINEIDWEAILKKPEKKDSFTYALTIELRKPQAFENALTKNCPALANALPGSILNIKQNLEVDFKFISTVTQDEKWRKEFTTEPGMWEVPDDGFELSSNLAEHIGSLAENEEVELGQFFIKKGAGRSASKVKLAIHSSMHYTKKDTLTTNDGIFASFLELSGFYGFECLIEKVEVEINNTVNFSSIGTNCRQAQKVNALNGGLVLNSPKKDVPTKIVVSKPIVFFKKAGIVASFARKSDQYRDTFDPNIYINLTTETTRENEESPIALLAISPDPVAACHLVSQTKNNVITIEKSRDDYAQECDRFSSKIIMPAPVIATPTADELKQMQAFVDLVETYKNELKFYQNLITDETMKKNYDFKHCTRYDHAIINILFDYYNAWKDTNYQFEPKDLPRSGMGDLQLSNKHTPMDKFNQYIDFIQKRWILLLYWNLGLDNRNNKLDEKLTVWQPLHAFGKKLHQLFMLNPQCPEIKHLYIAQNGELALEFKSQNDRDNFLISLRICKKECDQLVASDNAKNSLSDEEVMLAEMLRKTTLDADNNIALYFDCPTKVYIERQKHGTIQDERQPTGVADIFKVINTSYPALDPFKKTESYWTMPNYIKAGTPICPAELNQQEIGELTEKLNNNNNIKSNLRFNFLNQLPPAPATPTADELKQMQAFVDLIEKYKKELTLYQKLITNERMQKAYDFKDYTRNDHGIINTLFDYYNAWKDKNYQFEPKDLPSSGMGDLQLSNKPTPMDKFNQYIDFIQKIWILLLYWNLGLDNRYNKLDEKLTVWQPLHAFGKELHQLFMLNPQCPEIKYLYIARNEELALEFESQNDRDNFLISLQICKKECDQLVAGDNAKNSLSDKEVVLAKVLQKTTLGGDNNIALYSTGSTKVYIERQKHGTIQDERQPTGVADIFEVINNSYPALAPFKKTGDYWTMPKYIRKDTRICPAELNQQKIGELRKKLNNNNNVKSNERIGFLNNPQPNNKLQPSNEPRPSEKSRNKDKKTDICKLC